MPIVPIKSPASVDPGPLPHIRLPVSAPIEAFGGGIAAEKGAPDLSGAINAADRIAAEQQRIRQEEKARADQIAVTDAASQLSEYKTHALYNQNDGALTRLGKDAFGVPETLRANWDNVTNVIRNGLANDDQKAAFDRLNANQWSVTNEEVQHHVAAQRQAYDNQTTAAFITNKQNEALASYNDPLAVDSAIDYQAAAIRDHGKRNGLSPDVIDETVAKHTSATRMGVVEAMLENGQDLTAEKYFNDHRDQFVGNDLLRAEKLTEVGLRLGAAQRAADAITKTSTTLTDALTHAQSIDDPKIRDEVEQRVRRHFNDLAADQRQDKERAFMSLSAKLEQNGGNVDWLKATADWLALTPAEHNALEHRAKVMRNPDEGPGDNEAYLTLLNEAYFNPDQFAMRAIPGEKGLNAAQKARLMTLQRSVGAKVHAAETGPLLKAIDAANKAGTSPPDNADSNALNADPALDAALRGSTKSPAPQPVQQHKLAPPTPQMLQDIAKYGPEYVKYLRLHGIDAPDHVKLPEPAKGKKP